MARKWPNFSDLVKALPIWGHPIAIPIENLRIWLQMRGLVEWPAHIVRWPSRDGDPIYHPNGSAIGYVELVFSPTFRYFSICLIRAWFLSYI